MRIIVIWVIAIILLSGCSGVPDCRNVSSIIQLDNEVITSLADEIQREHMSGTFDGLLLVSEGDTVLFKSAYGCADREGSVKNSVTTISDMGSRLPQQQCCNLSKMKGYSFLTQLGISIQPLLMN